MRWSVVVGALVAGCSGGPGAVSVVAEGPTVHMVISSRVDGEIEPCG